MLKTLFSLSTLSLVGYVIGFINHVVISRKLGTSESLDLYLIAVAIVNFGKFFSGPIIEATIPVFYKLRSVNRAEDASNLVSKVINIYAILFIVISGGILISLPSIERFFISDSLYDTDGEYIFYYTLFLVPSIFLMSLTGFFNAILNAMGMFYFQNIGRVVSAIISLLILFVLVDYMNVLALVVSFNLGYAIIVVIQIFEFRKIGIRYYFKIVPRFNREFYQLVAVLMITYLLTAVVQIYEKYAYSQFGEGYVSAFHYSSRLFSIPQELVLVALSGLVWTRFMKNINEKGESDSLNDSLQIIFYSFLIALYATVFIHWFSDELLYIIFFGGKFDLISLSKTSDILRFFILALPFVVSATLMGRFVTSLQITRILGIASLTGAVIPFCMLHLGLYFGNLQVMTLSYCVSHIAITLVYFFFLYRRTRSKLAMRIFLWKFLFLSLLALALIAMRYLFEFQFIGMNKLLLTFYLGSLFFVGFFICLLPSRKLVWSYIKQ